jgi:hypothetical protein
MKKPMKPAMKPVQPMTQPEEVAAAEAEVAAEILPQDGLTVIAEEEEEAAPVAESSNDPLPSVPVDEEPVQPTPAPAVGAMHYLGTFAMDGVVGRGRGRAAGGGAAQGSFRRGGLRVRLRLRRRAVGGGLADFAVAAIARGRRTDVTGRAEFAVEKPAVRPFLPRTSFR